MITITVVNREDGRGLVNEEIETFELKPGESVTIPYPTPVADLRKWLHPAPAD